MDFDKYQREAFRTHNVNLDMRDNLLQGALGLTGESGEVVDIIKKELFHGHSNQVERMKEELGDCLWYIAEIASIYGLQLGDVAQFNVDKLTARYPDGFSSERSINRNQLGTNLHGGNASNASNE